MCGLAQTRVGTRAYNRISKSEKSRRSIMRQYDSVERGQLFTTLPASFLYQLSQSVTQTVCASSPWICSL